MNCIDRIKNKIIHFVWRQLTKYDCQLKIQRQIKQTEKIHCNHSKVHFNNIQQFITIQLFQLLIISKFSINFKSFNKRYMHFFEL